MKAIVLHEKGEPENLKYEDWPDPEPRPGEVVVKLKAAALNHRDVWIRKGLYAGLKFPIVLGSDGAGEVVALGDDAPQDLLGKDVVINPGMDWGNDPRVQHKYFKILGLPDDGTYAQFVKMPFEYCHAKPAGLSWEEAAAIPLAGLTAYRAVVTRARVKAGDNVLVTGIGGGVSAFALQIAKKLGANVFVTSGNEEKIERAKEMGADGGANYKLQDWGQMVVGMTDGDGPDVVIDSVGGDTLAKCVDIIKPGGRIALYGATTGLPKTVDLRRIFWKQLDICGSTMGTQEEFAAMLKLYDDGSIKPVVDKVFPLADAAASHERMEEAEQFGKIVLNCE
jgi:NADPH:quinone reductase-like Zn-dependent oxidoreductase